MKKAKSINLLLILFFCVLPVFVFAATLENKYPQLPGFSVGNDTSLLVYVFNLCVYAAGLIAVLAIIYQGVSILLSKGVVAKVEEAKDRIKAALLGLAILFGSYLLLGVINPQLTKIDFPDLLEYVPSVFTDNIKKTDNTVTYKEVPLGSIIEAILIPNSTSVNQIFNYSQLSKKTEENCYLYDKYGNTIDRNGDGAIDGQDVVEGLDMSVCMDNLLNAIIAKIRWFNGNETICNGNTANTAGPINAMKAFIQNRTEGCNQNNCALWPTVTYPDGLNGWLNGCKTIDPFSHTCLDSEGNSFEAVGTACESACTCCGGPRGSTAGTGASCQTTQPVPFYSQNNTYALNDPCKNRQKIDCARQEMNFRIYGHGLDLGLKCAGVYDYSPDIAPFIDEDSNTLKIIDYTDDNGNTYKAQFLTFTSKDNPQGGKERMTSFKNYFDNRLIELKAATSFINLDKTKNVLSLAEFQSLQESSSVAVDKEPLIPDYDPSTYHSFVCEHKDKNICDQGKLVDLKSEGYAFLPGEKYNDVGTLGEGQKPVTDPPAVDSSAYTSDAFAAGWPFAAKRIWNNKLASDTNLKSDVYNSGDPDTLYILSDAGTTDATKYSEAAKTGLISLSPTTAQCTLKDSEKPAAKQIDRGTLTSNIPIGQLADGMAAYVTQLDGIIDSTVIEIQNTIDSADKLANSLPESCNCSNAKNHGSCTGGDPNAASDKVCPKAMGWTDNFLPKICDYPPCPDAPAQTCEGSTCSPCIANEQEVCDLGCLDCGMANEPDSAYLYCLRNPNNSLEIISGLPDFSDDIFYRSGTNNCGLQVKGGHKDTVSILNNPQVTFNDYSNNKFTDYVKPGTTRCSCSDDLYYIDMFVSLSSREHKACYQVFEEVGGSPSQCSGYFTKDSDCYKTAKKIISYYQSPCLKKTETINLGPFWKMVSCKGSKMTIAPKKTINFCAGDDTDLTDDEKQEIEDANREITIFDNAKHMLVKRDLSDKIQWSTDDPNTLTYSGLNCCYMYSAKFNDNQVSISHVLNVPSDFEAHCVITNYATGKSVIQISKKLDISGNATKPAPKKDTKVYYVCPYNDIKSEQSKIYKQVTNPPSYDKLALLDTNQTCSDDIPGFLQRIELWQKRLWNYQNGIDLLSTDQNRFTLLDQLNITRTRFNECVQGFKIENKDAAARTYLFTCEEGMNSEKLGVNKILPQFPPYNSILPETKSNKDQWGCYPFNSNGLTNDQKRNCQINPGWTECQLAINQYTPDFYCCLSGQSSTH